MIYFQENNDFDRDSPIDRGALWSSDNSDLYWCRRSQVQIKVGRLENSQSMKQ